MKNLLLIALCFICFNAQAQQTDTAKKVSIVDTLKKDLFTAPDTVKHLRSKAWTLVPPAALIVYGTSNFFFKPVRNLDVSIYNGINKGYPNFRHHPEDFFQYAPVALTYGLNLVGIHGKNTFIDRTLIFIMAEGIFSATTFTLKKTTSRLRPDGSNRLSFPSGHTGNAFVGAEFMAQELGDKSIGYSAAGYSFATATGILRMFNRDHWFSDVIAGAGIGIISTKAAYLIYPYIRNRLFKAGREKEENRSTPDEPKKQKTGSSTILMPSYQNGIVGMHFAMQL